MTKLTINRKPKGIYGKPQEAKPETLQPDKTTSAHKVITGQHKKQQENVTQWRHMTKRQRKNRNRINRLGELWPLLFSHHEPKPLKVGILDDLMQDIAVRKLVFGTGALRAALMCYTHSRPYLRALMAGGARYDLKGQPCGDVTPEDQKYAAERLGALKERDRRRTASRLHDKDKQGTEGTDND